MIAQRPIISAHRLARLVAWLAGVLAWFALGAPHATPAQRRHHARHGHVGIATLRRAVAAIIIVRAAQLLPARLPRIRRDFAPPGFKRRLHHIRLRAIGGVWLRRYLNRRGSFVEQVKHLIEALRHARGLAAGLAWRRRRGLTRLRPLLLISARDGAPHTHVAYTPRALNSS